MGVGCHSLFRGRGVLWNVFIVIRYIFPLHVKLHFAFNIIWQDYLKSVSMENGFGEVLSIYWLISVLALLVLPCDLRASLGAAFRLSRPKAWGILVPRQGIKPPSPALEVDSQPWDHHGSPWRPR